MTRYRWNLLLLTMLFVGVAWILVNRVPADGRDIAGALPPAPAVGHPAPDFTLTTLTGETFALSDLRGKPVVLNFWATWCPPCIREMPLLDRFHREFGASSDPKGWTVLGLAIDRRDAVVEFLAKQPVAYPIALAGLEGSQWSRALGNDRGGLPFTVAIDASGWISARKLGELSEAELRTWGRG